ncbi:MAG: hypothetical protein AABZ69_06495 [Candidatus Binatota bacterium]
MSYSGKYLAMAAEKKPEPGKSLQEVPTQSQWWTGVVVDSALGFSATLVFILAGVLFIRKRRGQRGHSKYDMKHPRKQTS